MLDSVPNLSGNSFDYKTKMEALKHQEKEPPGETGGSSCAGIALSFLRNT